MDFSELRKEFSGNLKFGFASSIALHLVLFIFAFFFVSGDNPSEKKESYGRLTYMEFSSRNLEAPPLVNEQGGGIGKAISGTPVPSKKAPETVDTGKPGNPEGDSTKAGPGGNGTGIGTGGRNVMVFNKADYLIAAEMQPEPIGGYAAIDKKVIVPEAAKRNSIQGRVFVQAYINENGEVVYAEVLKGLGFGCDEEAVRVIKLCRFKAGKVKGRYVKVQMSVPINFRLN